MAERRPLDVKTLEAALYKAGACMEAVARIEDVVIFIGNSGAGKSTLINFLVENELVGRKVDDKIVIEKADRIYGPQIGVPSFMPGRYIFDELERDETVVLVDTFGFSDNKDDLEDICHTYCLLELYKYVKYARIILIIDFETLQDKSEKPWNTLLRGIENTLGNVFKGSFIRMAVIITKVPDRPGGKPATKRNLMNSLRALLNCDYLSKSRRDFIEHLISRSEKVGFFKQAPLGPVTEDIALDVVDVVCDFPSVSGPRLRKTSPNISISAMESFLPVYEQLISMDLFYAVKEHAISIVSKRLRDADRRRQSKALSSDELFDFVSRMTEWRENILIMRQDTNLEAKMLAYKLIDHKIDLYVEAHKLCEKAKYVHFVDKIMNTWETQHFNTSLNDNLYDITHRVETMIHWATSKIKKSCAIHNENNPDS